MPKQIHLNAFDMNCVGHIQQGLWTHPRDQSARYTDIHYWTDYARRLEAGLFDGIFLADVLGVYDVLGGSPNAAVRGAVQVPVGDPMLLVPAMAAVTQHLGFGVTANLTYETPYQFARRMTTLDHLTQGRIGWNIVTGYLDSAARAVGLSGQTAHDDRYDLADEYMALVYQLWEGSWADDAVRGDRASGVYADPARVRLVHHHGKQYKVDAMHLGEPSPQRTPVLFQAGSSARGQTFAGEHAECVFLSGQSTSATRDQVAQLRQAAVLAGRRPGDVKALMGITVVVDKTEKLAREKLAEYQRHASAEAGLAHFSAGAGVDYSTYALDDPLRAVKTNAIESSVRRATGGDAQFTVRHLLGQLALGGRYTTIVGDPQQVADALQHWMDETDIDGFNLARTVTPESYADFIDLVVPELQNRGVYKTAYAPGTLRRKLFGDSDRLPAAHPGAQRRRHPSPELADQP
jgi:FMN-dependent oxidoreductase (nitrilotriacetate monooxygenase family)